MLFASDPQTANVYMKAGMTLFAVIAIWFSGHLLALFNASVTDESQKLLVYIVICTTSFVFFLCSQF